MIRILMIVKDEAERLAATCKRCPDFRGPWSEFLAVLNNVQSHPCPPPNQNPKPENVHE